MFSMDELSTRLNISKQSLYKLINNNQELSTLIKQHSTREKRKIFYDDAVLEWLCNHYGVALCPQDLEKGVSSGVGNGAFQDENPTIPNDSAPSPSATRIKELEAKVEGLEVRLEEVEADRKRLREENGAYLLTITQMSNTIAQMTNTAFQQYQASVKALPAPRKPILERIKTIFGKGKQSPQEAPEQPQEPQ